MNTFNLYLSENKIKLYQYGKGERLLVVFHGFDESGSNYRLLESVLGEDFTIIVPDLPFHGQTDWHSGLLCPDQLVELIQAIMKRVKVSDCSVMGYSMGGRLAICLSQQTGPAITHLLLLAPEGLRKNPWLSIATGSLPGRQLFKWFITHPKWVIALAEWAHRFGWISKSMAAYVERLMTETSSRLRVYNVWMGFRKLRIKNPSSLFLGSKYPIRIWFGRFDRVIPPPSESEIRKWFPATISVLQAGHVLFVHEETLREIYAFLCDRSKHK